MAKTVDLIKARAWVQHVDDERNIDNGVIISLYEEWEFCADPGCTVRGFDTMTEALAGTANSEVRRKL